MKIAQFDTDFTEAQWDLVRPLLPQLKNAATPQTDCRHLINATLYLIKVGIPWQLWPHNFPPWKTAHHVFRQRSLGHTWQSLSRPSARASQGKRCRPTAAILGSQRFKSDGHERGSGLCCRQENQGRKSC